MDNTIDIQNTRKPSRCSVCASSDSNLFVDNGANWKCKVCEHEEIKISSLQANRQLQEKQAYQANVPPLVTSPPYNPTYGHRQYRGNWWQRLPAFVKAASVIIGIIVCVSGFNAFNGWLNEREENVPEEPYTANIITSIVVVTTLAETIDLQVILEVGSNNDDVLYLQECLNYIGNTYSEIPNNLVLDGNFGRKTEGAVIVFQKFVGLEPTGKVDSITWEKIYTFVTEINNYESRSVTEKITERMPTETTAIQVTTAATEKQVIYVKVNTNGDNLNLRSKPSVNSDILKKIPNGTLLEAFTEEPDWYYVQYDGSYGYVSKEFIIISQISGATTQTITSNNKLYGIINTVKDPLNLRSGPSVSASVLTTIPKGTRIEVEYYNSDWYYTEYKGQKGYVSSDYIKID